MDSPPPSQFIPQALFLSNPPAVPQSPLPCFQGSICVHLPDAPTRSLYPITVLLSQGEDAEGHFEVARSPRDFELVRKTLVSVWPGVFIPPLIDESEVLLGDSKEEARRAGLEMFLIRVLQVPCLFSSKTMRLFLHSGGDYAKTMGEARDLEYQSVYDNYIKSFGDFNKESDPMRAQIITKEIKLVKQAGRKMSEFQTLATEMQRLYAKFRTKGERLERCLETYEVETLNECKESPSSINRIIFQRSRPSEENPYSSILLWAKREEFELATMLETLESVSRLIADLQRLDERQITAKADVEKLKSGKFALVALLTLNSKGELIAELEAEVRVAMYEIPRLREQREKTFKTLLKHYALISTREFEEVISIQMLLSLLDTNRSVV